MQIPHCEPARWPQNLPHARFAAHIQTALHTSCRVALLGLPDDLGVRLNHGRPGASQGPAAFRAALARYGVHQPAHLAWPKVFDAGDVIPAPGNDPAALQETHRRVALASEAIARAGLFPIAIGGGHDLTFPFVQGVHRAAHNPIPWHAMYLDAHLDVRDTPGSGMPFRKLIESNTAASLAILGMNPLANTREHVDWFARHAGTFLDSQAHLEAYLEDLSQSKGASTPSIFASFDMDVLDQSVAPGVSATNPDGLTVATASTALLALTRNPSLRCLDFMELSPPHDEGGRTARVAAHLFLVALSGLAQGPLTHQPVSS